MNPILRNILAIIAGIVLGSIVNMGIVILGGSVIPAPEGVDIMDTESLKAGLHLFETKHFIFPFLAHALGTLAGAIVAAKIAANNKFKFAMAIGVLFLAAGISNVIMLPSPTWFTVLDLAGAYLPMAWFGGNWAIKNK